MIKHIHWMRGFAIIIIVIGHCLYFMGTSKELGYNVFRAILLDGTVLFVFISGFLFEHLSGKFKYKSFLKKKLWNVLTPYLIVASAGTLAVLGFNKTPTSIGLIMLNNKVDYSFYTYLTGVGHLNDAHWFIPMIMIFFIISPVLVYLNRGKYFYYLLPIFLAISVLSSRPDSNANTILNFINYFGIFQLGMFFSKYRLRVDSFLVKNIPVLALLTMVFTVVDVVFANHKSFEEIIQNRELYINTLQIQKIFFCVLIYTVLLKASEKIDEIKVLGMFADYSFGLFFIHMYFTFLVGQFLKFFIPNYELSFLLFFVVSLVVLGASLSIVYLVKKIFKERSRYLIGS